MTEPPCWPVAPKTARILDMIQAVGSKSLGILMCDSETLLKMYFSILMIFLKETGIVDPFMPI